VRRGGFEGKEGDLEEKSDSWEGKQRKNAGANIGENAD